MPFVREPTTRPKFQRETCTTNTSSAPAESGSRRVHRLVMKSTPLDRVRTIERKKPALAARQYLPMTCEPESIRAFPVLNTDVFWQYRVCPAKNSGSTSGSVALLG